MGELPVPTAASMHHLKSFQDLGRLKKAASKPPRTALEGPWELRKSHGGAAEPLRAAGEPELQAAELA